MLRGVPCLVKYITIIYYYSLKLTSVFSLESEIKPDMT